MRGPDSRTVAELLRAEIGRLAEQILPNGKIEGREYRGIGPDGATWCVVLSGRKQGVFLNTGGGVAGDALELVRYGRCGGDRRAAYQWACRFLGIAAGAPVSVARHDAAERERSRRAERAAADLERSRRLALRIFLNGKLWRWEDPPGQYLIGRGITPGQVTARIRALRYYPDLAHPSGRYYDAMVAAVIHGITGAHLAVHRTWLEEDANGWHKARCGTPKASLGAVAGGVISLLRGASNLPLPKAVAGEACLIAEGIENALSLAPYFPERRCLAAIAANNLPLLELPPNITTIMLIDDRDGENDAVRAARTRAHVRWEKEGRTVTRWCPPAGFKDANDYLQRAAA